MSENGLISKLDLNCVLEFHRNMKSRCDQKCLQSDQMCDMILFKATSSIRKPIYLTSCGQRERERKLKEREKAEREQEIKIEQK